MGIGLAVAATLFVVVDLLQTLDRFIRNKPPLIFILEHFVYRLPAALQQGLPWYAGRHHLPVSWPSRARTS